MNDVPRSRLTPADRDIDAFEASRLRALSLRSEAINAFWGWIGRAILRAVRCAARRVSGAVHSAGEAAARANSRSHTEA